MALSGLAVEKLKHQPTDPLLLVDLMSTALIAYKSDVRVSYTHHSRTACYHTHYEELSDAPALQLEAAG